MHIQHVTKTIGHAHNMVVPIGLLRVLVLKKQAQLAVTVVATLYRLTLTIVKTILRHVLSQTTLFSM